MLDLANVEMSTIFAVQSLPNRQVALFSENGTVLVLHEGETGSYEIRTTMKLLGGDHRVQDDDSIQLFLSVHKLNHRLGMFLCDTSDGLYVYQISASDASINQQSVSDFASCMPALDIGDADVFGRNQSYNNGDSTLGRL